MLHGYGMLMKLLSRRNAVNFKLAVTSMESIAKEKITCSMKKLCLDVSVVMNIPWGFLTLSMEKGDFYRSQFHIFMCLTFWIWFSKTSVLLLIPITTSFGSCTITLSYYSWDRSRSCWCLKSYCYEEWRYLLMRCHNRD